MDQPWNVKESHFKACPFMLYIPREGIISVYVSTSSLIPKNTLILNCFRPIYFRWHQPNRWPLCLFFLVLLLREKAAFAPVFPCVTSLLPIVSVRVSFHSPLWLLGKGSGLLLTLTNWFQSKYKTKLFLSTNHKTIPETVDYRHASTKHVATMWQLVVINSSMLHCYH